MRRVIVPSLVIAAFVTFNVGMAAERRQESRRARPDSLVASRTARAVLATPLPAAPEPVPAAQGPTFTVTGTVDVGNLPFDPAGNLLVSVAGGAAEPRSFHFVGVTQVTVQPPAGGFDADVYPIFASNRACHAEFPGTRICTWPEMTRSIPPPPPWSGYVLIARTLDNPSDNAAPYDDFGNVAFLREPVPVACCGL